MSMASLTTLWADATFLRPIALWLLLALPLVYLLTQQRRGGGNNPWLDVVDATLIPELFPATATRASGWRPRRQSLIAVLAWTLFTLALAGPSLHKAEVPTVTPRAEAVIALGLSTSMLAQDLTPDRLTRSRIAVEEWLRSRTGDEIGLIAFAGSAYRVSPLTRDTETLLHLLNTLQPDVMPRPGNDVTAGIQAAQALFSDGSGPRTLLLITDGDINAAAEKELAALTRNGTLVQVIGVGTTSGAPVPLANGRFATNREGHLQLATTDLSRQQSSVRQAGGQWVDVRNFEAERWKDPAIGLGDAVTDASHSSSVPQDDGVWLLLPLLLLAAGAFRRGTLWLLLAACMPLFQPAPATAAEMPDWLLNANQRAVKTWQETPTPENAQAIPDNRWRGVAEFQGGDYSAAEQSFAHGTSVDDQYNQALSMAYQDRLDDAITGFRKVLEQKPDFEPARRNLELLEQVRDQQQSQNNGEPQDGESGDGESEDNQDPSTSDSSDADDSKNGESEPSADPGQQSTEGQEQAGDDSQQQSQQSGRKPQNAPPDAEEQEPQSADAADGEATDQESASLTANPAEQEEAERTLRQWLRRVDSDPSRLLRERFRRLEIERQRGANARDN